MNRPIKMAVAFVAACIVLAAFGCGYGNIKGQMGPSRGMGVGPEPEEQGPRNAGSMGSGVGTTGTTGAPSHAGG